MSLGTPELEEVDVWLEQPDGSFQHYAMGYHRPYKNRPVQTRLFALPTDVRPGMQIYIRVHSTNAIILHATFWQIDAFTAHETRSNFMRGLYFGILLIAVVLYVLLGARLRDVVMVSYAGYIASQALFHLGTNGYLPVLVGGPHAAWWTDALPRIGWLGGAASIVLMWDTLLDLKHVHPRIHRLYQFTLLLNLALLPFALLPFLVGPWVLVVVKVANALNSLNMLISLTLLLQFWRHSRHSELLVYFTAFLIPTVAVTVNTAANLGLLPQNGVTTEFYQAGSLVHVLVMSYGLALRLRQLKQAKADAEQQAAVANQRAQEQRRFVAMLSHEFGNPLAAIDRSAQMLQIKLNDLPSSEAQRLLNIRNNAAALSRFVDNFLMTESLEHGSLQLSRNDCALAPLLAAVISKQPEPEQARVALCVTPPQAHFFCDAQLIGIAVGNLLGNALRYSPSASRIEVTAKVESDGLHIGVRDHGPGLDAAALARLGTPYFRAESALGKKGSGLGYYFTQRIAEAHGGTLVARSPNGEGLLVKIHIPAR